MTQSAEVTGHQHHFLSRLDRLAVPEVELALGLYRDHELVRFLLGCLKLPEGAERVALSLDDPKAGPFVIVTREGRFVTCLGRGMKPGQCPIVTRAQLDALSARHERFAAAVEATKRHGGLAGMLRRLYHAGDAVSREEIAAACEVQPLYANTVFKLQNATAQDVLAMRLPVLAILKRPGPLGRVERAALREMWEAHWMLGHLAVIGAQNTRALVDAVDPRSVQENGTALSGGLFQQWVLFGATRGIWLAARIGKSLLPAYKQAYERAENMTEFWEAHLVLALMALRHAKLRAEVEKQLSWLPGCFVGEPPEIMELVAQLTGMVRAAFTRPEELLDVTLRRGRVEVLLRTRHLPAGSAVRVERAEDVPEDVARAMAASLEGDFVKRRPPLLHLYALLPWLSRARPEDFYLPRAWMEAVTRPWTPERTRVMLAGLSAEEAVVMAGERERQGPSRKGACPCGSGKKYKRCCGAG